MRTDTATLPTAESQSLHSEEPRKTAIRAVVECLRFDFGEQIMKVIPDKPTADRWMWRFYHKVQRVPTEFIINGYEAAVEARKPYMPTLSDITDAILVYWKAEEAKAEEIRRAEEAAAARKLRGKGLAGYIEETLSPNATEGRAAKAMREIREATNRPRGDRAERYERLKKNSERLDRQIMEAVEVGTLRPRTPNIRNFTCAISGCEKPATRSNDTTGGLWYCREHIKL